MTVFVVFHIIGYITQQDENDSPDQSDYNQFYQ